MDGNYMRQAEVFKALSDPNRLMIVDMLSCGELCACKILIKLGISQPTLSHHMKTLCGCGLVAGRREGKWTYYTLNPEIVHKICRSILAITSDKPDCICKEGGCACESC